MNQGRDNIELSDIECEEFCLIFASSSSSNFLHFFSLIDKEKFQLIKGYFLVCDGAQAI